MFKMGSHDPFGNLKHKLWPKEGPEVKSPTWLHSRPLKVWNRPDFLMCRWHVTYCWKFLDEGNNFALNLISIRDLHRKLWAPKIVGIPIVGILGFPLGSPGTKCHLDASPMASHKVYYKREGGGFPQVQVVVSLVSPSFPVARPSTKIVSIMH
jgi:hypothetical protein